jgi:hypothetical protein
LRDDDVGIEHDAEASASRRHGGVWRRGAL